MSPSGSLRVPYVSPLQKLAFASLLFFLFLLHSRVLDLTLSFLHIPIFSLYTAVLAAFLGGGFLRAFTHRIGAVILLLGAWMVVCIPFSYWPGGSAAVVQNWLKAALVYVVIAGLIFTYEQYRRTIHLLAFSILALSVLAILFGNMDEGRLVLARGRFNNPNDLAQILLMGLPFWWYIATSPSVQRFRRALAYLAMVPIFMTLAKTGSRGALIAALIVAFVLFWRSSIGHKVLLIFAACLLVVLGALFLPKEIKDRYFTVFESDEPPHQSALQDRMEDSAISSTWGRWYLFKDSVTLTILHPIFGVGPGQFAVAQDVYSRAMRNQKGTWHVTHNTYTEFSSENGVPALIIFVLALVYCFRAARAPRAALARPSPGAAEVVHASFCLRLSLLAFIISACFASFAYQTQFLVLAGLSVAFFRTAPQVLTGAEESRTAQPAPEAASRVPRLRPARVMRPARARV